MAERPEATVSWAQARDRIGRGESGDKIAVADPAAAPLGTDAEAPADDIARSLELEDQGEAARPAAQAPRTAGRRKLAPWLLVTLALSLAVVVGLGVAG